MISLFRYLNLTFGGFNTLWLIDHWIGNLLSLIPIGDWLKKISQEAPTKYAELSRIVRIW
jgi:hypothetical protein